VNARWMQPGTRGHLRCEGTRDRRLAGPACEEIGPKPPTACSV
jgi:hypothetical protein